MNHLDGRTISRAIERRVDVVVVGSGPAGAAAARVVARAGASVLVVEAGPWLEPGDFELSAFGSMAASYRAMGASVVVGRAPMPYVQGRMVGGSSPINGAICWRLPHDVWQGWTDTDPALGETLSWDAIEAATDAIEARLGVAPTRPGVAGRKSQLMALGAESCGLAHRPIRRNVRGCEGLGRCMQGCPRGRKESVDRTLLVDALEDGAAVLSSAPVRRVRHRAGRVVGVEGRTVGGGHFSVEAGRVVLAASAIQTPSLLLASGLGRGPVGHDFQCHPGVSMAGRFATPVRMWEGATQGHEVIGLRKEGLKFETLGFGPGLLASRLPGVGRRLRGLIDELHHWVDWGVAVKAEARGRVRRVFGRTVVTFTPTRKDTACFARGLEVLGQMLEAAGAERLAPGVRGAGLIRRASECPAPKSPGAYLAAITHMFGTCRMGSDPRTSVVRPDFRLHGTDGLYVADSSVFPTNTGVNPQVAIMALATLCGEQVAT